MWEGQTHEPRPRRSWVPVCATACVFAVAFGSVSLTSADMGLTYDEPIYGSKAMLAREWLALLAGGQASYAVSNEAIGHYWAGKDQHPGVVKLVGALGSATIGSALGGLASFRVAGPLFFATLCASVCWFLQRYGWPAAVFGTGSLATMPRVFGHAHLMALDVPVAAMSFLTAVAFLKAVRDPRWRWAVVFAVVWGLALGCKLNAFFVPFPLVAWWLVYRGGRPLRLLACAALVAPLVFWLTWPWLWYDTIARVGSYVAFHGGHGRIAVDYLGRTYADPPAPWHYPLVMTAITTPGVTLLAWCYGLWNHVGRADRRRPEAVLMAMCALVQMAAVALPGVPKYNGVRLFLAAFPFLCVLGGLGAATALDGLARWGEGRGGLGGIVGRRGLVTALAPVLLLMPGLAATVGSFPSWLSYYNGLVGGPCGALRAGFEPTYWGDAYLRPLAWLSSNAPSRARVVICQPGIIGTLVDSYRGAVVREDLEFTEDPRELRSADYCVFHTRRNEIWPQARVLLDRGRPVYVWDLDGAPLAVVYEAAEVRRVLSEGNAEPAAN